MLTNAQTPIGGDVMSAREAIKDPIVIELLDLKDAIGKAVSRRR
jgi:predicted nuclease of restriction endonuclease-like (RecB) superfamily